MKIWSLISLAASVVLATLSWTMASVPIADPPLIIPLVVAAAALAMPALWQLTRLLIDFAVLPLAPALRLGFPAPLTGEPPATAFA